MRCVTKAIPAAATLVESRLSSSVLRLPNKSAYASLSLPHILVKARVALSLPLSLKLTYHV